MAWEILVPQPGIETAVPNMEVLTIGQPESESQSRPTLYSPRNSPSQNTEAFPFSRGSSQPRGQTQVSHISGKFFTSWGIREAQEYCSG